MEDSEKKIKQIEAEIKQKKKELQQSLESPFDNVGAAQIVAKGMPRVKPNIVTGVDGEPVNNPHEIAYSQRMGEIARPASNLSPEGTREWAEKEIHNLAPEAVASLKWDIKYGDKTAMAQARKEIFQAMGIDKREANNFGKGGQIVINLGGAGAVSGDIDLPFLRRAKPNNQEPTAPIIQTLTADKDK